MRRWLSRSLASWAVLASAAAPLIAHGTSRPSGEDLYLGRAPALGQLRGSDGALPAAAVACVNCHEPGPQVDGSSARFAPRLDAQLTQALPRRGGPAVPFDEASFCHLLRTGIDPAQVLVRRAMPFFHVSDGDCASLWQFVSQRAPLAAGSR